MGHVFWQGRAPAPSFFQQLALTLTIKMGATEVAYPFRNTDASGYFTVTANLPGGVYGWRVKNPKYLANAGTFLLVRGTVIQVEMGTMRPGDCNDDNVVNAQDFIILKNTFGHQVGEPSYDDSANFNGDLVVNVLDFNLMKPNFGRVAIRRYCLRPRTCPPGTGKT